MKINLNPNNNASSWIVYIISCADDTLYTGITTNISRRIKEHNSSPKGAKYTRARRPVSLVYQEHVSSRSTAAKREHEIKQLTLVAKIRLIKKQLDSSPNLR